MTMPIGCVVESDLDRALIAVYPQEITKIPIVVGTYVYVAKQDGDKKVLMTIVNLKRIPNQVAKRKFPFLANICSQVFSETGVLFARAEIIGVIESNKIKNLLVPLLIGDRAYLVGDEEIKDLSSQEQNVITLGHMKLANMYDEKEGTVKEVKMTIGLDIDKIVRSNMLISGLEEFRLYDLAVDLIRKISSTIDNYNFVVFDTTGNFVHLLKNNADKNKIRVYRAAEISGLLNNGFGFEYRTREEIVKIMSAKIGYKNASQLEKILESVGDSYPLSMDKIVKVAEALEYEEGFINLIKNIWQNNAGALLEKGTINIIDLHKGVRLINQTQLIYTFFRYVYDELLRRYEKNENVKRFFIIDTAERFIPKKEIISEDVVNLCKDSIVNIMIKNRMFRSSIICVTETPSMMAPVVLHLVKNVMCTKIIDKREINVLMRFFNFPRKIISNIDEDEYVLKSDYIPIGRYLVLRFQ
ncbi:MAG: hypothetical protein Q6363_004675 [Candidatus Njordarchaeota archaeon]